MLWLSRLTRCVHWRTTVLSLILLSLALGVVPWASGSDTRIVRVEEEWELIVGTPDLASNSPQVTCAMSPSTGLDGLYMTFEVNHRSGPDYVAGGLNMLVWVGERHLVTKSWTNSRSLTTVGETVCWTQAIEVREGQLTLEVIRGRSTTWGDFASPGFLKTFVPTLRSDLNSYSPTVSAEHSGVTFASGSVQRLVLKSIRYYRADGTMQVDATPRVIVEEVQTVQ
ncbi:MAG: hypothetical protein ACYC6N_21840 [Pirellulaceae bacterium]